MGASMVTPLNRFKTKAVVLTPIKVENALEERIDVLGYEPDGEITVLLSLVNSTEEWSKENTLITRTMKAKYFGKRVLNSEQRLRIGSDDFTIKGFIQPYRTLTTESGQIQTIILEKQGGN